MARDKSLCAGCISDKALSAWVAQQGDEVACAYCGDERRCCSLEVIASKIDTVLRRYYTVTPEEGHVADYTDNIVYYAEGESAEDILKSEVIEDEDAVSDLIGILSEDESRAVSDGDDALYDGAPLRHVRAYADEFLSIWDAFEQRLKHEVRFFDDEGRHMLDLLFGDLPTFGGGRAVVVLDPRDPDTRIYRARIISDESAAEGLLQDPARHVGPPPPSLARAAG